MKTIAAFVFVSLLFVSACGTTHKAGGADVAVISVGDRSVFPDEVGPRFENHRGDTTAVDVLRDNIIARELIVVDAMNRGFEDDFETQRLFHEREREILQSKWLAYNLDQVEVTGEQVRDFIDRLGTGVRYTAFYHEDSLLIDSVLQMVLSGEDLSRLAEELAFESLTRRTKGVINLSDRNNANSMDSVYLATASVGDIIGPFRANRGWRILQIDSMWTYTPDSLTTDSLRVASMLRARFRESRKKFMEDSLKTVHDVQAVPEIIELIAEHADERGTGFSDFSPEEEELTVVTWDNGHRSLRSMVNNILGLPPQLPRRTGNTGWLEDYATRLALFDIEMQEAIALGLDTVPETARSIDVKHWETLLDKYYETVISPRIEPDSTFLQQVYAEMKEGLQVPEERVFDVLFLKDSTSMQEARAIMDSGGDVLAQKEKFEPFPPILAPGEETETVPLRLTQIPENDRETLFGLSVGDEAVVQLPDSTGLWFRLKEVREEHIPEFEEVRQQIVASAEQQLEVQVIEELVDSLSGVYPVFVDSLYFEGFYVPAAETDSNGATGTVVEVQ